MRSTRPSASLAYYAAIDQQPGADFLGSIGKRYCSHRQRTGSLDQTRGRHKPLLAASFPYGVIHRIGRYSDRWSDAYPSEARLLDRAFDQVKVASIEIGIKIPQP